MMMPALVLKSVRALLVAVGAQAFEQDLAFQPTRRVCLEAVEDGAGRGCRCGGGVLRDDNWRVRRRSRR